MNKLIMLLMLNQFPIYASSILEGLTNTLTTKNSHNNDLLRTGIWLEQSGDLFQLGYYESGKKIGFWIEGDSEHNSLEKLDFYKDGESGFKASIGSEGITLNYLKTEINESGINLFNHDKDTTYKLVDFFDSSHDKNYRIMFSQSVSLTKFDEVIILEFPVNFDEKIFLQLRYHEASDFPKEVSTGLVYFEKLIKIKNGKYHGIHYIYDPLNNWDMELNYQNGWLHGNSFLLGKNQTESDYIINYNYGEIDKVLRVCNDKVQSSDPVKVKKIRLINRFKRSHVNFVIGFYVDDYLTEHLGDTIHFSKYYNNYFGIKLSELTPATRAFVTNIGFDLEREIWD